MRFFLFLSFALFSVFLFFAQSSYGQLEGEGVDMIVVPEYYAECRPNETKPEPVHSEKSKDGTTLEVRCFEGNLVLKVIRSDGGEVYAGKCLFPNGANTFAKKADLDFTMFGNELVFVEYDRFLVTEWRTFDAPPKPAFPIPIVPPPKTGDKQTTDWEKRNDKEWYYDVQANMLSSSKTTHDGRWVRTFIDDERHYLDDYEIKNIAKIKEEKTRPPVAPAFLIYSDQNPSDRNNVCTILPPNEDVFYTPVPINGMVDGKPATFAMRIPSSTNIPIVQLVEAVEGQEFVYDMNFISEDAKVVRYELVEGPEGMTIGDHDGIIQWIPDKKTAGSSYDVKVKMQYLDATPISDSFTLRVRPTDYQIVSPEFDKPVYFVETFFPHGTITDAFITKESPSLTMITDSETGGPIELTLPRDLIDSLMIDGNDSPFIVYVDDLEISSQEIHKNDLTRTVAFELPAGKGIKVDIVGTYVVPEFPVGYMVLAITMTFLVMLHRYKRFDRTYFHCN